MCPRPISSPFSFALRHSVPAPLPVASNLGTAPQRLTSPLVAQMAKEQKRWCRLVEKKQAVPTWVIDGPAALTSYHTRPRLCQEGSVIRQGQGGEKPHPWRKPRKRDCPQYPPSVPWSYRTGLQWFNVVGKDAAYRVCSIPATDTQMAVPFYFKTEIALATLSRCPLHTGTHQTCSLISMKARPHWETHSELFHYVGLNLTRKLECSLGNIKYPHSVLSGPISQTVYLGDGGGGWVDLC